MGVRAPHGAGLAVKQVAHRALLACPLGVKINEDYLLLYLRHISVCDDEGVVGVRVQREAPHEVQHAHITEFSRKHRDAAPRTLGAEVCRAQDLAPLVKIGLKLGPCPGVVAEGDNVRARAEDGVRLARRDADDVRVFTVHDGKIYVMRFLDFFEILVQKRKSRLAADIAHGQYSNAHLRLRNTALILIIFYHKLHLRINAISAHNKSTKIGGVT